MTLSASYAWLASARRAWYERHPHRRKRLRRPVISVGNLVAGGSGKTPVVAALARLLLGSGERPAILSRGYARRIIEDEGVVVVSDGDRVLEPVERSGDEPQMLARSLDGVPVLVSADRYLAGTLAERRFGSTVLLLDDGFQHLQLARDVDLLIVTDDDLRDRPLPSGRLRESLAAASAADAVVVFGSADDAERISARLGVETAFRAMAHYDGLRPVSQVPNPRPPIPDPCSKAIVAVAGIARPERFFAALAAQGWDVRREITFPDHHWFTARDLERVHRAAGEVSASLIVTTEKDAVRLAATDSVPSNVEGWVYLPMQVSIEPTDAFASWLLARL